MIVIYSGQMATRWTFSTLNQLQQYARSLGNTCTSFHRHENL